MISIKSLYATSIYSSMFIYINFSIEDTVEDLTQYRFDLYRSNSPVDNFSLIHTNIIRFEFCDYCVDLSNPEIKYFYKIKIINTKTGKEFLSDVFTVDKEKEDEYTYYLQELYNMYLDTVINNNELLLIKKIRTGQRCDCYDDIRSSSSFGDKCKKCWGTGYLGGYYPPIKIMANFFNTAGAQEEMAPTGTIETKSSIQLWTPAFPIIQENDIILDTTTNQRSRVMSVRPSIKNGKVIRQTLEMIKIPEGELIYRMPIEDRK